ncbi:hypothetical protein JYT85_01385 [Desulfocapsa sp. AH-315-G09]|uniref:Uncharacterized protein n=1 Tax=Desulfotalea psychrophila TaxID=84980 RepID=A0ABS3AUU0_9BACT|nr:hypothetical protein [Desulfocapsa sp.]MBN4065280.1 hypothetical protein [Desulfocapsa sp. AH-315-G09]MBN4068859.1 hypothetical protein [Desulfotalea psychrophila]
MSHPDFVEKDGMYLCNVMGTLLLIANTAFHSFDEPKAMRKSGLLIGELLSTAKKRGYKQEKEFRVVFASEDLKAHRVVAAGLLEYIQMEDIVDMMNNEAN